MPSHACVELPESVDRIIVRLGLSKADAVDSAGLRRAHRAFALHVPYDNTSIQLGILPDPDRTLELVAQGKRGGWCYDLNTIFARILERLGFSVRLVLGAGNRETLGDDWIGSHLALLVDLPDGPWLADVGYGDGPPEAVPLTEHQFRAAFFSCSLRQLGEGWWRYQNDPRASAPSFDIHESAAGLAELARMRSWLATNPSSPYVQNFVAQRWQIDSHMTMRGKVLTRLIHRVGPRGLAGVA